MFKVIIAGSRDFNDYSLLESNLDFLLSNKIKNGEEIVIVSGKARGADTEGEKYAINRNFSIEEHPANWNKYGKSAGYIRNREMALSADACVCFWDGKSKGTKHMINLAKEHNLLLEIINY